MTQALQMLKFVERYHDKIKRFCDPLRTYFGVNEFDYNKITKCGHYTGINLNQDWVNYYFSEGLFRFDPLAIHPDNHHEGMIFLDDVQDKSTNIVLDQAIKECHVHLSFVISCKVVDGMEFYVFGLNSSNSQQLTKLYNEIPLIRLFIKRFREEFRSLIQSLDQYPVDMKHLKGPSFESLNFELFPIPIERIGFLEKIGLELPQPLTPKEITVSKHLIKGLSAPRIAKELFISSRTVEHHIERIKDKFDCSTKAELIQKIQSIDSMGLLSP